MTSLEIHLLTVMSRCAMQEEDVDSTSTAVKRAYMQQARIWYDT